MTIYYLYYFAKVNNYIAQQEVQSCNGCRGYMIFINLFIDKILICKSIYMVQKNFSLQLARVTQYLFLKVKNSLFSRSFSLIQAWYWLITTCRCYRSYKEQVTGLQVRFCLITACRCYRRYREQVTGVTGKILTKYNL